MNMYELIRRRYLAEEIGPEDVRRAEKSRVLSKEEAEMILRLKENQSEFFIRGRRRRA